jgi:flagellin-like hook-associated protein FlgL/SHS2 domain-containing protein
MGNAALVKKAIKPFALVFGSALGLKCLPEFIFGDDDSAAKELGIGDKVLKSFLDITGSVLSERFGGLTDKLMDSLGYGQEDNLENAIRSAYRESLNQTRKGFITFFSISDKQALEQLGFFTDNILEILNNDEQVAALLQQHQQLDVEGYIRQVFQTNTISYPTLIEQDRIVVTSFFVEGFKKHFPKQFVEQLKTDDKAKTTYFKQLIESVIINTRDINTHFTALRSFADQTGNSLQEIITTLKENNTHIDQVHVNIGLLQVELQKHVDKISSQLQELKNFTRRNEEPHLDYNIIERSKSASHPENRFDYKTQFTHFIGRHHEKYLLWEFLESNEPFSWWMLTGPGGMGKSRLAQEFCALVRQSGYHAGFYNLVNGESKDIHAWEKWQFRYPTLLVIDYALSKVADVQELIAILYKKCKQENHKPVRLLLLERDTTKEWEDAVKRTEVNFSLFRQVGSQAISHQLAGFDEHLCWQIIAQVHLEKGKGIPANRKEVLVKLKELDPQERPLYAFFVGVALAEGENIREWNVANLLDYHLNRLEQRIWMTVPVFKTHKKAVKNLLVVNTLTRGLHREELISLIDVLRLRDTITPEKYSLLSDTSINNETSEKVWVGLLPDILGEYFVLEHLNDLLDEGNEGKRQAMELLRIAWQLKPPVVWWMYWLCISDFNSEFEKAVDLLLNKDILLQLSGETEKYIAYFLVNTINTFGEREVTRIKAYTIYEILRLLTANRRLDELWIAQAKAAYNLIRSYGGVEVLRARADELYGELKSLAADRRLNEIWIVLAQSATNLIYYYGGVDALRAGADELYIELKLLAADRQLDEIWIQQAKAAYILINKYERIESLRSRAVELYEELKVLAACRRLKEIWIQQANVAFNLINENRKTESFRLRADELYEELKVLANDCQLDEVWIEQAQAANNLISDYGQEEYLREKAEELYVELKKLAAERQLEEIWKCQATAIYNLITEYSRAEPLQVRAYELYGELKVLAAGCRLNEIWECQAHAAFNLIGTYAEVESQRVRVDELYDDLKELAEGHRLDAIWITQAYAAFNLITTYAQVESLWVRADELYDDLKELAGRRRLDAIWITQAQAAFNLITAYGKVESLQVKADELYAGLKMLAADCRKDEVWIQQAQAANSLLNYKRKYDPVASYNLLFDELYAIAKEKSIAEIWLTVECSLTVILLSFHKSLTINELTNLKEEYRSLYLKFYQHPAWEEYLPTFIETMKQLGIEPGPDS